MIRARFEGGPFDGQELGLAGKTPTYLLLISGERVGWTAPIVVGADFDDHWPGQQRYEVADEALEDVDGAVATVIYEHRGP